MQRSHGRPNSDAMLVDIIVVEKGRTRLLAKDIIGPIVVFGWRPDSCGNSERLFRSPLPMPCRDGQQSWTCVIPVSERSFADRSGLVEIHVTRATSGEDFVVSSTEYVVRLGSMLRPSRSAGRFIFKPPFFEDR